METEILAITQFSANHCSLFIWEKWPLCSCSHPAPLGSRAPHPCSLVVYCNKIASDGGEESLEYMWPGRPMHHQSAWP